jgi:hypothetical protein
MKGWLPLALGLLAIVLGALWTVQGLGYIQGSVMTGQRVWVLVGAAVGGVGLIVLAIALAARRRRTRS